PATPSVPEPVYTYPAVTTPNPSAGASQAAANPSVAAAQGDTYKEDDLIGAAEGVFGKGAEGLARLIEDVLAKQGEPNGYIVGRVAGGRCVLGARNRYGARGEKIEGHEAVY